MDSDGFPDGVDSAGESDPSTTDLAAVAILGVCQRNSWLEGPWTVELDGMLAVLEDRGEPLPARERVIERALELMAAGVEIPDGDVQRPPQTADGDDLEQAGHMSSVVALLEKAYEELGHAL
jgi:hypothetical protein